MSAAPARAPARGPLDGLPERAAVWWRPRADPERLDRRRRLWTVSVMAHTVPLTLAAVGLSVLSPALVPVSLLLLAHAWAIPELYAARGSKVLRPRRGAEAGPEARALLLLGDLIGEQARRLHSETGLVLERGELGSWVVGEAGALLVSGGRGRFQRVDCYCVHVNDAAELPAADRIAHLLLALRCDERDFVTVANLSFAGACWRLRRRLPAAQRPALDAARSMARAGLEPASLRL